MKVNGNEVNVYGVSEFGDAGWTEEYGIELDGFEDVTYNSIEELVEALRDAGYEVVL